MLDERDEDVAVVGLESHAVGHLGGHDHAGLGVIAGKSFPQVVKERAHQQQIGPVDSVGQCGGVGARLEQVPVHGEAVVRVALRLVADRRPLGQVAVEELAPVERLDGGDGRPATGQHPHERGPE